MKYEIKHPFINPPKVPTAITIISIAHIGTLKLVISTPPTIAANRDNEPMDKSIPPVIITNVTPIAKKPIKYEFRNINENVSNVKKFLPAITKNTYSIRSATIVRNFCNPFFSNFSPHFSLKA